MCKRSLNWLPLTRPQLGTRPDTQARALTGNPTGSLSVCRPALNPLSPISQSSLLCLLYEGETEAYWKLGNWSRSCSHYVAQPLHKSKCIWTQTWNLNHRTVLPQWAVSDASLIVVIKSYLIVSLAHQSFEPLIYSQISTYLSLSRIYPVGKK